ncbi:Phenylalanyl-tRNA synthetase, beta subunit, cytoplasmic [Elasticomyces elasticus]|nr:Phenylalanyl-tRNA synthetase, beta subunit, cytoplasmic [Elasticomyces elasticus]
MPGTRGAVPVPLHTNGGQRDLTEEILEAVDQSEHVATNEAFPQIPQGEIKAALDRLASRSMVEYETKDNEEVILTEEGQTIADEGSHEYQIWDAVQKAGRLSDKDLAAHPASKFGRGNAIKAKWIKKDGDGWVSLAESVTDHTRVQLQHVQQHHVMQDPKQQKDYTKRKLITTRKVITYVARKGPRWAKEMRIEVTDLTAEMIADGSWKTANFKPYNFNAKGTLGGEGAGGGTGALHPLNKVREEFRKIFFNMGFEEMPTARFVDSGFWNFDALYVPQQHPARDLQDTFYVSDPPEAGPPGPDAEFDTLLASMDVDDDQDESDHPTLDPAARAKETTSQLDYTKYYDNVRAVHQDGKFGSIGYRYPFKDDEPKRLVLRTHTTSISAYVLHRLSANPRPCRYFSIDRVFRNETVDATHLAEFHQIEGVIADYNLTLGGLQAFLKRFFRNIGVPDLKFKPAYNPYTEPSMEVFAWHEGLNKIVEIGNSGMFRPEMLLTMGLPPDLRVYGFGLSLERPTMIKYGISNIRELLGHKVDLGFIEGNPAVRLDRE